VSDGLAAVLVEAFSEGPGAGNGAAVVRLSGPASSRWMQAVAGSLRQAETAFLLAEGDRWLLRWFTPSCEVPLCGHATLAAVLALGYWGQLLPGQELALQTRSGALAVGLIRSPRRGGAGRGWIALPGGGLAAAAVPGDLDALLRRRGLDGVEAFWRSPLGYAVALVSAWSPLERLHELAGELAGDLRSGLVVMQPCPNAAQAGEPPRLWGDPADYQLRFFAPGLGIPEDAVTGSAHALVAPWWMQQLGRARVVGWQCSDRPGGMVCEALSSATIRLTGSGHLLWDGTLFAGPETCAADSSALEAWRELASAEF
jgi:predicted PhzF superfamily epimerase YddE/YHI9